MMGIHILLAVVSALNLVAGTLLLERINKVAQLLVDMTELEAKVWP